MTNEELIKYVIDPLKEAINATNDSVRRIHERIDQLVSKDYVSRKECEDCRLNCKKGVSSVVAILGSLVVGLISAIVTYVLG
jgi:tetrahydromethanopterin S-methyltransferase subunit G